MAVVPLDLASLLHSSSLSLFGLLGLALSMLAVLETAAAAHHANEQHDCANAETGD